MKMLIQLPSLIVRSLIGLVAIACTAFGCLWEERKSVLVSSRTVGRGQRMLALRGDSQ